MKQMRLGRTGLEVSRIGFGALQIATKYDYAHAQRLLNLALDLGINMLDTARGYQDSEERIGRAISHRRDDFFIATKSGGRTRKDFWESLDESLRRLRTDHVDIYQFHGAETGSEKYIFEGESTIECMREARDQGKIRFIGFSSHSLDGTLSHARSGHFDVLLYPVSYVGNEAAERGLVQEAERLDVGFLGMKPFGGGRLGEARYCLGYVLQFPSMAPVIGFETEAELREVVNLVETGVELTDADRREMAKIKSQLGEKFCRGCGYCQPCPQGVPVLSVMFYDVYHKQFGDDWIARDEYRKEIELVDRCEECRQCVERCPFDLDIPVVMREIVARYRELMRAREGRRAR
ncbi:MAG: aldo/keto reductase [Armatimonadota bacterium]|nr:MAG: aldo/keto reductase [Armatimonadota bacterium]